MLHYATVDNPRTRPSFTMRPRSSDWLSVAQAAEVLGVDRTTLHRWRVAGQLEGEIRTRTFGKQVYYWRPDIDRFKLRHEAGPDVDDHTDPNSGNQSDQPC